MAQLAPIAFRFEFGSVRLLQDAPLGTGAYGQVCKAMLGELPCAAKLLHPILVDPNKPRNRELFEQECRFLSEIRHPNIVQYLGLAQDPTAGLSILLMELMDDSLTHYLELSEVRPPYHVQVNINYDIAQALAFLHSNQIVHRDLSSNNVLLIGNGVRAKVADFGMSKLNPGMSTLTMCPGTRAYMSPEALLDPPVYSEKLDCFQAGVLMVQIITRKFPDPSDTMRRVGDLRFPTGWVNVPVPEADRRSNHLSLISPTHPILPIAMDCLKDVDTQRPSAQLVCRRLSSLKEAPQYSQSLTAKEGGERGGEIQERDQLIQQLQQDLRTLKLEKDELCQDLQEKDALINELKQSMQLTATSSLFPSQMLNFYTCQISGPGLHSATANHPTHVLVELSDSSGRLCSLQQNVTAELELISEATPTSTSFLQWMWSKKPEKHVVTVAMATSPSQYMVSYTAVSRGQHKLHVRVNNREINGIPFTMTVYPDPTQLGRPVRVVTGLNGPYGITFNSHGEMIISEYNGHQISICDIRGQNICSIGSPGDSPEQMNFPTGIAIDDADNIYVSSYYKLQKLKFTSSDELTMIKYVGQRGSKEGEFDDPRGVTLYDNQVYVCDRNNHRIHVFDLDLNFIRSIGSRGKGRGEFNAPCDVKFDSAGNMYVAEFNNERVQVMDINGRFIRAFGQEGKGKLKGPSTLHIVDKYVYVSDVSGHCIVVYETSGQFVTSFGRRGHKEGEFHGLRFITSCADGFIHVCDSWNNRVQIF